MRREVYERDGGQCTFVDELGRRCSARAFLELDHRVAKALGGSGDAKNIRLLCRFHNALCAERTFGRSHIDRAIRSRQRKHGTTVARATGREEDGSHRSSESATPTPGSQEMMDTTARAQDVAAKEHVETTARAPNVAASERVETRGQTPSAVETTARTPNVGAREVLDTAARALKWLGFRDAEAQGALRVVESRLAESDVPPSVENVIRHALGILT